MELQGLINQWKATKSITVATDIVRLLEKNPPHDTLVTEVIAWGRERGITDPYHQLNKVIEEVGEAAHEITRDKLESDELQDAIGDILVTVILLADTLRMDPIECLQKAYDTIKDRQGHTSHGTFIKADN